MAPPSTAPRPRTAPPLGGVTARAASFNQVTYDVTGGTFNNGLATGSITGGQLRWITAGPISTPSTGPVSATVYLTLTGPSGFFRIPGGVAINGFLLVTLGKWAFTNQSPYVAPAAAFSSGPSITAASILSNSFVFAASYNQIGFRKSGTIYGKVGTSPLHLFDIGNEVRTTVPEPAITPLVLLGLTALASFRGIGARIRRRRIAR